MKGKFRFKQVGDFFKNVYIKVGKRNLIVVLAILVIGGAVAVNYKLLGNPIDSIGYGKNNMADNYEAGEVLNSSDEVSSKSAGDEYFAATVLSRQKARDEALEVLQTVIDSTEAMEDTKKQAYADISQIAKDIESETNIETLIEAKGFEDCVAVVNGSTVNVVVKTSGLLPNEIAQINEIVYENSGAIPANVKIVERT